MTHSQSKGFLNSAEAIKELWGEEINETNRKRLKKFIEAGYIKGYRTGERGKWYIPRAEIQRVQGKKNTAMGNRNRD
tara:strand:+ start:77 stop:307 length:231 start_codon:yes stop_codon:yes gene_type:complete